MERSIGAAALNILAVLGLALAVGCQAQDAGPVDDPDAAPAGPAAATAGDDRKGEETERDRAGEEADHDHEGGDADHTHDLAASDSAGTVFAAGQINTAGDEYGVSFSPDGATVYFVRPTPDHASEHIYRSDLEGGVWSDPRIASFSGRYNDKEPFVAPDGERLYFASKRPVQGSGVREDFDLWVVERVGEGWGRPTHLAGASSSFNDDYPAVTADGTLFFTRDNERSNRDLYSARPTRGGFREPERLPRPVNSVFPEADPYVAQDGSFLIFSSLRASEDAYGQGDLYITFREDGGWTQPRSLGPQVNTTEHEYAPMLSPDGLTLYFSRGFGEILMVPASAVDNFLPR